MVNIEKIDFLAFNKANLELMELVVHWAARTLGRIEYFESLQKRTLYDAADAVFTYFYMEEMLKKEFERARMSAQTMTFSILKLEGYGFLNETQQSLLKTAFLATLKHKVSKTDLIFNYRYGGTYALISPLKKSAEVLTQLKSVKQELEAFHAQVRWGVEEIHSGTQSAQELLDSVLKQCGLLEIKTKAGESLLASGDKRA